MEVLIDKRAGRGALQLDPQAGRLAISSARGALLVTGLQAPITAPVVTLGVLIEDGSARLLEDGTELLLG